MITYTADVLERIEVQRRERVARLAAEGWDYDVQPDHVVPGGFIVRNRREPGLVQVVNAAGECSCRRFQLWGRCSHAARVEELHGTIR